MITISTFWFGFMLYCTVSFILKGLWSATESYRGKGKR